MQLVKDDTERILAIDYGEKRIGLAISDPLKLFAIPLSTIKNNIKCFNEIDEMFAKYKIVKIVMGYPLSENGNKTKLSDAVIKFANEIKKKYKIEVIFVDERYSSAIAWEQIKEGVTSKKKRKNKALVDMKAAAVILEDFLKNNI